MKIQMIIFVFIFLLFSCKKEEDNYICTNTINIPKEEDQFVDFDTYFKLYQVVKLETNPNCLINNIDKIYIHRRRIYILDITQSSIFLFKILTIYYKQI